MKLVFRTLDFQPQPPPPLPTHLPITWTKSLFLSLGEHSLPWRFTKLIWILNSFWFLPRKYIIQKTDRIAISQFINSSFLLAWKDARIFVPGHYLMFELNESIVSKNKYPSTFWHQREAIVFITLQMFLATRTVCQRTNIRAHFRAGQMEAILSIALQIFLTTRTVLNLGNNLLG